MAPPLCSCQVYTERTFDAFYRLSEPGVQIRAHVEDIVRSKVTRFDSPINKDAWSIYVYRRVYIWRWCKDVCMHACTVKHRHV